jgi:competence ComEA-like helix-hairpin-helix protein
MPLSARGRLALLTLVATMAAIALARREDAAQVLLARGPARFDDRAATEPSPRDRPARAAQAGTPAAVTGEGAGLRDGHPMDPNRASAAELELLPGVGPSLARRLVETRERAGPYRRADDLLRVPGVGPKTLAKLTRWLRFGSEQLEHTAEAQLPLGGARDPPRLDHEPHAQVEPDAEAPRPQVVQAEQ